jgi:hypothetical protein
VYLFGLTTAGLGKDSLPFNLGLVIGMDGAVDVESVLQNLTGAGVDHGPLLFSLSADCLIITITKADTYEGRGVGRHPRDEDNLAPAIKEATS